MKPKMKICILASCILGMMALSGSASAQILVAACIGGAPTVTRPAADTLDIVGTACRDTINLDVILAATPAPAIMKVNVSLSGQNDSFTSSGHAGVKLTVKGGTGNDTILVGGMGATAFAQVDIYGEAGNDHLAITENPGQAVGGSGADLIDSGETTTLGPIPNHNLISGTLTGPADDTSVDTINCFDGPPANPPYYIILGPADGDIQVGC